MTQFTRIRPVLPQRGAVSRFNDNTMEYVIALARVLTGVFWLGWVGMSIFAIMANSVTAGLVAGFLVALFSLTGWFGFKINANEEWKHDTTQ